MLIYKTQVDNKEYCWFHSTNVHHSEVDLTGRSVTLNESGVEGLMGKAVDVKIVFNRGATYLYKNVPIHDYVAFIEHLNREDHKSSGKAFNKFIKIYPFDKMLDTNLDELEKFRNKYWQLDEIKKIEQMAFKDKVMDCYSKMINGNVTDDELIEWYGQEVFDKAHKLELEYYNSLDQESV